MLAEPGQQVLELVWLWTSILGLSTGLVTFRLSLGGSDFAPLLVMATVPIQRELLIGQGDTHLTFTQAAICAFLTGAGIRFLAGQLTIRIDAVAIATGVVSCLYGLSIVASDSARTWAEETYRWVVAGLFLVVARSYFSAVSGRRVLYVVSASAFAVGIWAMAQVVFEAGPPSFVRSGLMRAFGGFGEPNPFSAFAWTITLPLVAFCAFGRGPRRSRAFALIGAGFGLVTIVLTQSRGGFLGAATGGAVILLCMLVRQSSRYQRIAFAAIAFIGTAGLVAAVVAAPWDQTDVETTTSNWANQERTAHWSAALQMIEGHSVFGVGAGGYSDEYRSETTSWRFRISRGHAHNAYLQVAAEAGIPAVLAYIWLLASIAASLVDRAMRQCEKWLPIGVLALTAALAVHQLVDFLHVLSLGVLFAGLWAAALSVGHKGLSLREHHLVS